MTQRAVAVDGEPLQPASRGISRATRWLRVLPWLLVVALSALNVLYMSRLGPNDDAYITYRVARNLAAGLGPVYTSGERVLTITTPGYMLLLAAGSVVSHDFVRLGLALNGLALLAVGALVITLSASNSSPDQRSGPAELVSVLAAIVAVGLTLTFPLLTAAIGMETPFFIAAILATLAAYRRAVRPGADPCLENRWLLLTAAAAALAFLLRPDGLLVAVAVGLHWIVARRRLVWPPLVLFVALSLPWLLFAWLYYGSPVPNTLAAKATQALGQAIPTWGPGLVLAVTDWAKQFPAGAFLAAIGLLLAPVRRQTGRLPMLLWAALTIAAHTLLDVRSYYWYYAPFAPVLGLLAADAVAAGADWLAGRVSQSRRRALATVFVVLSFALALAPAAAVATTLTKPPDLRNREQAYLQIGDLLRDLCAARGNALQVGMGEIGLVGYVSNCPVVDFSGLLQRDVAHLRAVSTDKIAWTIQRYQPEYLVFSGDERTPFVLGDTPWFRQRYEPLEQVKAEGFVSTIYRRGRGPEAQRDLPGAAWWRSSGVEQPIESTLYFAPDASPAITLHTFLPPESTLTVSANGQELAKPVGSASGWQDVRLPTVDLVDRQVHLSLEGSAGSQPAMVAWIESNALPAVRYFVPLVDAGARPRPTIWLEPGESRSVQLGRPGADPVALELLYRDRPGVRLAVIVDDQLRDTVGGTDGWRVDQVSLPDAPVYSVELRNAGGTAVRVAYAALAALNGTASLEKQLTR